MSDIEVEEEQSPNPRFWLEFRTFDDGLSSPVKSSSTLTAFPQFAQLPPELRLRIWSYLVQPRIIIVSCLQRDERLDQRLYELNQRSNGRSVPVLLHINRESRYLAMEHYELAFRWRISKLFSDTPVSAPPRVWFNFALDVVYLVGELEPYDIYGFNSAMVYFLRREDAHRVKHLACVLGELGYAEQESDQVFGCLFHVVDMFPAAKRVLMTVGERDEEALKGSKLLSTDNVMQKIWNGFLGGSARKTSPKMADKEMLMIEEHDLAGFVASH